MATNIFHSGQKLTAQDLNNALDGIAGIRNPSNDYKWQQTSLGRMQTTWDVFKQADGDYPSPLDVGVAQEALSSAITFPDGTEQWSKERIFISLGSTDINASGLPLTKYSQSLAPMILPFGMVNDCPYIGCIGLQMHWKESPAQGDGELHFSFLDKLMAMDDSIDVVIQKEQLYKEDVARPHSPTNWFYTGLCPEYLPNEIYFNSDAGSNICASMCFVRCDLNDGSAKAIDLPVLTLFFEADSLLLAGFFDQKKQQIKDKFQDLFNRYPSSQRFIVKDVWMRSAVDVCPPITIAQFNSASTFNAGWNQVTNDASRTIDWSAWRVTSTTRFLDSPEIQNPVVRVQDGSQRMLGSHNYIPLGAIGYQGVNNDERKDRALVAWFDEVDQLVGLSALSCDYYTDGLSGILNRTKGEGHHDQASVVFVERYGVPHIQYLDTCPNFTTHYIDSKISSLNPPLSSLQKINMTWTSSDGERECMGEVHSIWDFQNFENTINMPTDEEELEKYDMLVRYVDNGTAQVKYMALSSLSASAELSVAVDSEGASGQKSIAWLGGDELELYKMEEDGISASTRLERIYDDDGGMNPPRLVGMGAILPSENIPDGQGGEQDVEFVIRKGGAGGEIDYAKITLSAALSSFAISGDTNEGQAWPQGEHAHRSVETKYNQQTGNLYHQIYNFDDNTTQSEDIQLSAGVDNYVLPQDQSQPYTYDFVMRKHDTHSFESEVDYLNMNLKLPPISGDSQIVGTHDFSLVGSYTDDGAYKPMLYNWHGGSIQHVHVKTDGESYYWPQDTKTPSDGYYFLVKHQTTGGDWILEYKQLIVDMPEIDITSIEQEINDIHSDILVIQENIEYLSSQISAQLSGDYWELGGDQNTCYGAVIGDEDTNIAINLNNRYLNEDWSVTDSFGVGYNLSVNNDAYVGGTLTIGNTTITETQLSALLQLVQVAPQLLHQV